MNKLYGLVACGGKSSRMGRDKSLLTYYQKPQRYHLYEILGSICDKVFISCNPMQALQINNDCDVLTDLPDYQNTGPAAALLTAFEKFPYVDLLIVGCDYPFISENDLKEFLFTLRKNKPAAAFYHAEEKLYEPLLAWYSSGCLPLLKAMFHKRQYSLQDLLKRVEAEKYISPDSNLIQSVNTQEEFESAKNRLKKKIATNFTN